MRRSSNANAAAPIQKMRFGAEEAAVALATGFSWGLDGAT
jgi:hypothetical protein